MAHSRLQTVSHIFANAEAFEVINVGVAATPQISAALGEIREWFHLAQVHQDSPDIRRIRFHLALLRRTIVRALLPFQEIADHLSGHVEVLIRAALGYPDLEQRGSALRDHVMSLTDTVNPKVEALEQHLAGNSSAGKVEERGLISPGCARALSGWSGGDLEILLDLFPDLRLITSRTQLLSGLYTEIILPWGDRDCPFLDEVYFSARARQVVTLAYPMEPVARPVPRELPRIPGLLTGSGDRSITSIPPPPGPSSTEPDEPVAEEEWELYRSGEISRETTISDREFLVDARLVILANGSRVFLADDGKIVELSAYLDGHVEPGDLGRLPRKPVKDLQPGDIILLRTSGSGDFLDTVAEDRLRKDGRDDVLRKGLDWKDALRRALQQEGARKIHQLLAARGHNLQVNPMYIWKWTTDEILAPRDQGMFYELIAILEDLGLLETEALETAEARWRMIREIRSYRKKAAAEIRNALLTKVREIIRKKVTINDELVLSLPGVDAGEMACIRVVAMDPRTAQVAYHRIGTVTPLDL